ncbi:MAG: YkgJ family cysteine cluster protein [Humidesulfovibrio sp.]|nr:YkgJ family cysteine cluster protein [Humidesulfovibrio sp.]
MTAHPPLPQRRLTIALERLGAPVLAVSLSLPAGPASFVDILPAVRTVADALQNDACRTVAQMDRPVSCARGCGTCCNQLVMLGEAEALALLRTLRALPEERQASITGRFRAGLDRLESTGLLPELYAAFTREAHNSRRLAEMQAAYWKLALPCPFLDDDACGIYAERPLICRQYAMTTPPAACKDPFGPDAALVKVLPPVDLAGAAAAFDGQWAHASRVLPLLLCLLREATLSRRPYPVQEPEPMLLRFLDFASEHYARKEQHS